MMKQTQRLVLTGLMTALVFLLTYIVKIPVPFTSGYIHLGDSMIFLSVLVVGPFYGAFAAGFGSMFSDLLGGYAQYALPTLVIKALMALLMGLAMSGKTRKGVFAAAGSVFLVWTGFLAALYIGLIQAAATYGEGLAKVIVPDGGADELAAAGRMAHTLPRYLLLAFVGVVLVVAAASWFVARRDGKGTFTFQALIGMVAGGMCMIIGYWLVDSFVMGYGALAATFTVPMSLLQFAGGILLAAALTPGVTRARLAIFHEAVE